MTGQKVLRMPDPRTPKAEAIEHCARILAGLSGKPCPKCGGPLSLREYEAHLRDCEATP